MDLHLSVAAAAVTSLVLQIGRSPTASAVMHELHPNQPRVAPSPATTAGMHVNTHFCNCHVRSTEHRTVRTNCARLAWWPFSWCKRCYACTTSHSLAHILLPCQALSQQESCWCVGCIAAIATAVAARVACNFTSSIDTLLSSRAREAMPNTP